MSESPEDPHLSQTHAADHEQGSKSPGILRAMAASERRKHQHRRLLSVRHNSYVEEERCLGVFTSGGDSSGDDPYSHHTRMRVLSTQSIIYLLACVYSQLI